MPQVKGITYVPASRRGDGKRNGCSKFLKRATHHDVTSLKLRAVTIDVSVQRIHLDGNGCPQCVPSPLSPPRQANPTLAGPSRMA